MHTTFRRTLIATGCAVAVAVGTVAPAFAAEPAPSPSHSTHTASLGQVQERGEKAIDKRLAAIQKAVGRLDAAKHLTTAERDALRDRLHHDAAALTALRTQIAATTTVAAARADDRMIVTDYRVYHVLLPQVAIAGRTDALHDSALPHLQKVYDRLAAHGADKARLAELRTMIAAAEQDLNGLADEALAVTPRAYDADHTVMAGLRHRLDDAVTQVRNAQRLEHELAGAHHAAAPKPAPSPSHTS